MYYNFGRVHQTLRLHTSDGGGHRGPRLVDEESVGLLSERTEMKTYLKAGLIAGVIIPIILHLVASKSMPWWPDTVSLGIVFGVVAASMVWKARTDREMNRRLLEDIQSHRSSLGFKLNHYRRSSPCTIGSGMSAKSLREHSSDDGRLQNVSKTAGDRGGRLSTREDTGRRVSRLNARPRYTNPDADFAQDRLRALISRRSCSPCIASRADRRRAHDDQRTPELSTKSLSRS